MKGEVGDTMTLASAPELAMKRCVKQNFRTNNKTFSLEYLLSERFT